MAKPQSRFVCQQCGYESPRWLGRCPECEAWSSFSEEVRAPTKSRPISRRESLGGSAPLPITDVATAPLPRFSSGVSELDRVLGGGIVPGALILVGGDPGIGKSTLLTQVAGLVAERPNSSSRSRSSPTPDGQTCLYISGEESIQQIRLRSERLGAQSSNLLVVNETELSAILHHIESTQPALAVIDSIQTTYDSSQDSAPGTVSQIRSCAAVLAQTAKSGGPAICLIGHVTKEGNIAGPRVLEHMVDTVLYFEGDGHHAYRILRAVKNRFGSTDEIGIFEMREDGLKEVSNPSAALLAERMESASGSAVTATIEGSRPLLVEVQALVARSFLANPRRTATGIDYNRVNMLLAVLEKRAGLRLAEQDVFVNVAGGIRIVEPAADLAVAMSVASNFREQPVDRHTILIGEVGLAGEIRSVPQIDRRLREAARLGFKRAVLSRRGIPTRDDSGLELVGASNIVDAMRGALVSGGQ